MMQKFRFECSKSDSDGYETSEYPNSMYTTHEFEMSDDCTWDVIMEQFAKFLDMVGYIGVHEAHLEGQTKMEKLINAYMEKQDADISNPGLSD
jgi:hypothetical protein